jgi:uncharacterized protein YhfF
MMKILLLSTDHRVYQGRFFLAPNLAEGTKSLRALGFETGGPVGTKPPFFILLLEGEVPGESPGSSDRNADWHELKRVIDRDDEIYEVYTELMLGGYKPKTKAFDVFCFGSGARMAAKLGHLVTNGQKRGTAGWAKSHEKTKTPIPEAGGTSLVTDGFGLPLCFIETADVKLIKFKDVTDRMAKIEGEGDLSLEDWKRGHLNFWQTYDAKEINEPFHEDELIFFETFRVVKILGRSDT